MKKKIWALTAGLFLIAANLYAGEGDFIVEGNVGIGASAPIAPLDITHTFTATTGGIRALRLRGEYIPSSSSNAMVQAISGNIRFQTTNYGEGAKIYGLNFTPFSIGNGDAQGSSYLDVIGARVGLINEDAYLTVKSFTGVEVSPYADMSINAYPRLTATDVYGMNVTAASLADQKDLMNITNNYGIKINDIGAGTVEFNRGVAIADLTTGTNNTNLLIGTGAEGNWSIYNNSGYDNYFAGNLGIGTTAPQSKLAVAGLPTSPPDSSGTQGIVCITNNGNMWIDTNSADGICN